MVVTNEQVEAYLSLFEEPRKESRGNDPAWLEGLRQAAIERFGELGFPTARLEAWKYTNLGALSSATFEPALPATAESVARARWPFPDLLGSRLVFVNSRFSPELSSTANLPSGVTAGSLASAVQSGALEEHLGRHATFADAPFIALNTAFFEDGAFIRVPRGVVLEEPILALFVSTGFDRPTMTHPRNLILAERESQAVLAEVYIGLGERVYFTNPVTEIVAEENSHLEYVKVQQEGPRAFHIAALQARQERSSNLSMFSIALGAGLDREDLTVVLDGEGSDALLNGLYVETGEQHVDNYTTLDHAKPHCNSRELYKGVLDGKSTGVFHGRIIVRPDAQKTDAKQSNKNLLLSEDAVINTKPQLEIYADDVKCTHGATVGQVDSEAVFYLRSRGIALGDARAMLTLAFANEILGRMKTRYLAEQLRAAVAAILKGHGAGR